MQVPLDRLSVDWAHFVDRGGDRGAAGGGGGVGGRQQVGRRKGKWTKQELKHVSSNLSDDPLPFSLQYVRSVKF